MNNTMTTTAPERIWLQVNINGGNTDLPFPPNHYDVTWAAEEIGGDEVAYVRADTARARDSRLLKLALETLAQIASTPRNRGARRNAKATLVFIQTQRGRA